MATGYDLLSTLQQQAFEKQTWDSMRPMACPNDGTPLLEGPVTEPSILYCPFDGWQYPRDYDVNVHSGM